MCSSVPAADQLEALANDAFHISMEPEGSLRILPNGGPAARLFRPEFTALVQRDSLTPTGVKWQESIYNLTGWKVRGGPIVRDVFKTGVMRVLCKPKVALAKDRIEWKFSAPDLDLRAEIALKGGRTETSRPADEAS